MRGFTLIELVMVMIIIGIMAIYVAPKLNISAFKVVEKSEEVIEAVRYAQVLAMEHSGTNDSDSDGQRDYYGIRFDANGYTVAVMDSNSTHLSDVPNLGGTQSTYQQSWGSGEVSLTASQSPIFFSSRGEPLDSSGTPLTAAVTLTLTIHSESQTMTLHHQTGFIYR